MGERLLVTIPQKSPWVRAACGMMGISTAIRLWYYLTGRGEGPLQLWLPVGACLCFLTGIALGGRWAKPACAVATLMGVAFFLLKARSFAPLHQLLCSLLYLGVLILFELTIYGRLPTKYLLYPLFGLPLAVHVGMDLWQGFAPGYPPGAWGGPLELSVLCIMAGLLCLSIGLEVRPVESTGGGE